MTAPTPNRVFLTGFMGAGKSTVGRLLAKRLGFSFVDTDEEIVRRAGISIPEIFAKHGEEEFRRIEHEVIAAIAERAAVVVALGGGALTREPNRKIIFMAGTVAYLKTGVATLVKRLSRTDRPLLRGLEGSTLEARVREMLAARETQYAAATLVVETDGLSAAKVAGLIEERLKR